MAVEDAVLTGRAESLGDGLVQILVAISRIGILADLEPKEVQQKAGRIRDALTSAALAIAADGRVPLFDIGGRFLCWHLVRSMAGHGHVLG